MTELPSVVSNSPFALAAGWISGPIRSAAHTALVKVKIAIAKIHIDRGKAWSLK
jgi:hypothetical protein